MYVPRKIRRPARRPGYNAATGHYGGAGGDASSSATSSSCDLSVATASEGASCSRGLLLPQDQRGARPALTTKRRITARPIRGYAPIGGAPQALLAARHLAVPDDCFSITVTHHTGAGAGAVVQYRVRLTGELDNIVGEQLRLVLSGIITTGTADSIIVDLDNLAFLDSQGVRALLDGHFAATWAGKDFHVRNAHGIVHRVLTVLGLLPVDGGLRLVLIRR